MKSRLSNHLHGHYLLLYFVHRTHNNVWNDKAYSSIVNTYFALITSNDSALFLPNSKYMHFKKKYFWLSLHVCTLPVNILKVEICRNICLFIYLIVFLPVSVPVCVVFSVTVCVTSTTGRVVSSIILGRVVPSAGGGPVVTSADGGPVVTSADGGPVFISAAGGPVVT